VQFAQKVLLQWSMAVSAKARAQKGALSSQTSVGVGVGSAVDGAVGAGVARAIVAKHAAIVSTSFEARIIVPATVGVPRAFKTSRSAPGNKCTPKKPGKRARYNISRDSARAEDMPIPL
jgi:hypothetical protein